MKNLRQVCLVLFLAVLFAVLLFGCRAFEPAVVVVNRPPDTFIMGAPAETTGCYFHFHVYWYGTDSDGVVERFVWALTDTSIQDHETDEDEEDQRFNPALDIGTLAIGRWTTRTDSVFNFALHQGSVLAYDMTLHMVAVDDRGDFDRIPARLHFISNALGNPRLFFRKEGVRRASRFASMDTIAYGEPFALVWWGETPNIRSFTQAQLVAADTVPGGLAPDEPRDGLLGFKHRLPEVRCDESREDCWQPRRYDDASGDSASYFGDVRRLEFTNDDQALDIFHRRLKSGIHTLLVNTIDVAGVEVPLAKQALQIVVNYDPETHLLRGETDPLPHQFPGIYNYDDSHVYPYYRVFYPGGIVEECAFVEGDTVPDRSYAVFKSLGRDDPRDWKLDPYYGVDFQSALACTGLYSLAAYFGFAADYDTMNRTPEWEPDYGLCDTCWTSDTLGFLAGPFEFDYLTRSVDEHGKRDGTASRFEFHGNRPPCTQCIELLSADETSAPGADYDCYDSSCQDRKDVIYAAHRDSTLPPVYHLAAWVEPSAVYFDVQTGEVWYEEPVQMEGVDTITGQVYAYRLALHGRDHPQEPALLPQDRIMSWRYEIVAECDPRNNIRDGAGADGLNFATHEFHRDPGSEIYIDDEGVWYLMVNFFVPDALLFLGSEFYLNWLCEDVYGDEELGQRAFDLTTIHLGRTRVTVIARDASNEVWRRDNSVYHYYKGARPPELRNQGNPSFPHLHRASGQNYTREDGQQALDYYAFESEPMTKHYRLKVLTNTGEVFPGGPRCR